MAPSVSVIVPAYRSAAIVEQTVQSLLDQSCSDWEAWLVDDGSGDDTLAVLQKIAGRDSRLEVLTQQNLGTQAARNRAVERSRGEWIALLDHDDLWLPNKLEEQLALLGRCPDATVLYSNFARWDGTKVLKSRWDPAKPPPDANSVSRMLQSNPVGALTAMIRADALRELGGFDDRFLRCGDWDLWLRVQERGWRFCGTSEVLGLWRVSASNLSGDSQAMRDEAIEVLRAAVQRCGKGRQQRAYSAELAVRLGLREVCRAINAPGGGVKQGMGALFRAWAGSPDQFRLLRLWLRASMLSLPSFGRPNKGMLRLLQRKCC